MNNQESKPSPSVKVNKFSKGNQDQPLFKDNGDGYDIAPAGVLLLMADTFYSTDDKDTTPKGRANALRMIERLMKAACDGGYTQGDILMTMLARCQVTQRTKAMAIEAMNCAGSERIGVIFESMGGANA